MSSGPVRLLMLGAVGLVVCYFWLSSLPPTRAVATDASTQSTQSGNSGTSKPDLEAMYTECEKWTKSNSRFGVDRFTGERGVVKVPDPNLKPLIQKLHLPDDIQLYYRVGMRYRAQGDGLLMVATCTFQPGSDPYVPFLLLGRTEPAK